MIHHKYTSLSKHNYNSVKNIKKYTSKYPIGSTTNFRSSSASIDTRRLLELPTWSLAQHPKLEVSFWTFLLDSNLVFKDMILPHHEIKIVSFTPSVSHYNTHPFHILEIKIISFTHFFYSEMGVCCSDWRKG